MANLQRRRRRSSSHARPCFFTRPNHSAVLHILNEGSRSIAQAVAAAQYDRGDGAGVADEAEQVLENHELQSGPIRSYNNRVNTDLL